MIDFKPGAYVQPDPNQVDTSKAVGPWAKARQLYNTWNKQSKVSKVLGPIEALGTLTKGAAGTLGILSLTGGAYRDEATSIQQRARNVGSPMAGALKTAGQEILHGPMGASNAWDMSIDEADKLSTLNQPFHMPTEKTHVGATARFAIDVFDPVNNAIIVGAAKPVLNLIAKPFISAAKIPAVNKAFTGAVNWADQSVPGRWTHGVVNWLEKARSSNIALTLEGRYNAAVSTPAAIMARALPASLEQGTRRFSEMMYGSKASPFKVAMDNVLTAQDTLVADATNALAVKQLASSTKFLQQSIPDLRSDFETYSNIYRELKPLSAAEKLKQFHNAYVYGSSDAMAARDMGAVGDVNTSPLNEQIARADQLASEQFLAQMGVSGEQAVNLTNAAKIYARSGLHPPLQSALDSVAHDMTSPEWLTQEMKLPAGGVPSSVKESFQLSGLFHTMDENAQAHILSIVSRIEPFINSYMSPTLLSDVVNAAGSIPAFMTHARTIKTVSKVMPEIANALGDTAKMKNLLAVGAVKDQIAASGVDNKITLENFLAHLQQNDPAMHNIVETPLRKLIGDGHEPDSKIVKQTLITLMEGQYLRSHAQDFEDRVVQWMNENKLTPHPMTPQSKIEQISGDLERNFVTSTPKDITAYGDGSSWITHDGKIVTTINDTTHEGMATKLWEDGVHLDSGRTAPSTLERSGLLRANFRPDFNELAVSIRRTPTPSQMKTISEYLRRNPQTALVWDVSNEYGLTIASGDGLSEFRKAIQLTPELRGIPPVNANPMGRILSDAIAGQPDFASAEIAIRKANKLPMFKGVPLVSISRSTMDMARSDAGVLASEFFSGLKDKATLLTVEKAFNEGAASLGANPLQEAVRRTAQSQAILDSYSAPGAHAAQAVIDSSNAVRQQVLQMAKDQGLSVTAIKGLAQHVRSIDDAFGRFAVRNGLLTGEAYTANQGWHLTRGYEFYKRSDIDKAILPKLEELNTSGTPMDVPYNQPVIVAGKKVMITTDEADRLFSEYDTLMNSRNTYAFKDAAEWQKANKAANAGMGATDASGGINTGFTKQRVVVDPELRKVLGMYDDIASVNQLTTKLQSKVAATTLQYKQLDMMGLAKDANPGNYVRLGDNISWGSLAGKYVHPWLQSRLSYLAKPSIPGELQKIVQGVAGWTKMALITNIPTTLRNMFSNYLTIGLSSELAGTGINNLDIMSSMGRAGKEVFRKTPGGPLHDISNMFTPSQIHEIGPMEQGSVLNHMEDVVDVAGAVKQGGVGKFLDIVDHANYMLHKPFALLEQHAKLTVVDLAKNAIGKDGARMFSDRESVLLAEKLMIDYGDVPPMLDLLRRNAPLFLTYPVKMAGNLVKWAYENPGQHLKLYNRMFQANRAGNENFANEIALLPDNRQNKLLLRVGGTGLKKPKYLDATYYFPHSIFSINNWDSSDPVPQKAAKVFMNYFGPVFQQLIAMSTNKDQFGRPILDGGSLKTQLQSVESYAQSQVPLTRLLTSMWLIHKGTATAGQKRKQGQDAWYPALGIKQYDLDEEARIKYAGYFNQIKTINRDRKGFMLKMLAGGDLDPNTMQRYDNRYQAATIKHGEISRKLHDLSKAVFTINELRDAMSQMGVPEDESKAYIQTITNNDADPTKMENIDRMIRAAQSGDITSGINPTYLQPMMTLPVAPQVQGGGLPARMAQPNNEVRGRAGAAITRLSQPPLLPPPGRLNR